jgi:hypothetical protein
MSCEYYINGKPVSEETLKEALNNGLLDTLIDNNVIKLEGFKVDPKKVTTPERVLKEQSIIPAHKLQEILIKEVKTRQGYPNNMLEALELNAAGTDFKIPLWSSNYAGKFESLLTSIVSSKVIKQKFPGHSYVLGSEEGFRFLKDEESDAEWRKTSGIIFSDKFDRKKGLQPMRWDADTKKILPAQIMIPFKFRNENGKLLNVEDFTIKDENGKSTNILDTSKIPEKVLQLFGFRIPTQERNSMAAVEIVGFLPEASGDLLLGSRDWTKQMGSDFDVDKLFTYMRNTFHKDGKLYTNFLKDPRKIESVKLKVKDKISKLKDEINLSKKDRKLIDDYINEKEDYDELGVEIPTELSKSVGQFISELIGNPQTFDLDDDTDAHSNSLKGSKHYDNLIALNEAYDELKILDRSYTASRQNAILDIHDKVMTSTNPEVIASIIALDSFGEFEGLADDINRIRKKRGFVKQHSTILSDSYQRMKYINATAGKNGVGSFSLDSSFNSVIQGKDLVIDNLSDEGRKSIRNKDGKLPYQEVLANNNELVAFGNTISFGDLSNKYTLESQRIINEAKAAGKPLTAEEKAKLKTKATIIRTLQSAAVDNEKAQLLDKLNINDGTFDAVRAMALLGFEEKEISGLLTQEIVWEYIEELSNARSSFAEFVKDPEDVIYAKLIAKYDTSKELAKISEDQFDNLSNQTGDQLLNNIESKTLKVPKEKEVSPEHNIQQLLLLSKFRKLTEIGKDIKKVQSAINSEAKGAPNSLLETAIKVDQIDTISQGNIVNTENLLGEYDGGKLVNPTTINGHAAFYGVKFANTIYDKYFPYKEDGIVKMFDEVKMHLPLGDDLGTTKKADIHADIFKGVRSFLISTSKSGLFTENVNIERNRLFVDVEGKNKSLATIIKELSEESWFTSNGFLNKLGVDLNSNGEISRVIFEAAAGENFDERNIHQGINDLLVNHNSIGTFNGHEYTQRMLAQDLIMAAFLDGGNQGAKQYLKYVPVHYLKSMGFGEHLASSKFDFSTTFKGIDFINNPEYIRPSEMTIQYFQNNPEKARSIELNQLLNFKPKLGTFKITEENSSAFNVTYTNDAGEKINTKTHFLSIYDSNVDDKYTLYRYSTADNEYKRIEVAKKSNGFSQYNADGDIIAVGKKNTTQQKQNHEVVPQDNSSFAHEPGKVEPSKKFEQGIVNNNNPNDTFKTLQIDKKLKGKFAVDNLLNAIENGKGITSYNKLIFKEIKDSGVAQDLTVKYIDNPNKGIGSYNADTNTVTYNTAHLKDFTINQVANVFIHELSHAATSRAIKAYGTEAGRAKLSVNTIQAIENLEELRQKYIKHLEKTGQVQGLENYTNYYWGWKYDQITPEGKRTPEGKAKYLKLNDVKDDSIPSQKDEDRGKFYGAIKLQEFVAMALTDPDFQQHLNEATDEDGTPWWTSFMELLNNLLSTLGIDIKRDSLLASAIDNSMELIRENNPNLYTVTKPVNEVVKEPKYELFPGVYANQGQRQAIDLLNEFLTSDKKAFLLQGKGGTGKTTIIKKIIENAKTESILAIGPTHKAKKVLDKSLKEVNKKIPAVTLASALAIKLDETTGEFKPDDWVRKQNKVPIKKAKLIIIDEASMVSDKLLKEIKEWKSPDAKIIFMGDRAQLPPVGQDKDSNVFGIQNGYELTEKMRQAASSPIINIGTKIAANVETETRVSNPIESSDRVDQFDLVSGSSLTWESSEQNAITDFVTDLAESQGDVNHAKIITFNNQNHNSPQSVKNLNSKVRRKIFGESADTQQFFKGELITSYDSFSLDKGGPFAEKIFENSEDFIIESFEEVSNQTITVSVSSRKGERRISIPGLNIINLSLKNEDGEVLQDSIPVIANSSKEAFKKEMSKLWNTDKQLAYAVSAKIANLEYGYAITSHKAQGSTYENVYVMEDNIMGASNRGTIKAKNQSLYVAVSRPKTKLVMVSIKNSGKSVSLNELKEKFQSEPSSFDGVGEQGENSPSQEDMDAYNRMRSEEEDLIFINAVEEYMKICKR